MFFLTRVIFLSLSFLMAGDSASANEVEQLRAKLKAEQLEIKQKKAELATIDVNSQGSQRRKLASKIIALSIQQEYYENMIKYHQKTPTSKKNTKPQ